MSEQDRTQATPKQRDRRRTNKQNSIQIPAHEDLEAWKAYWQAQNQPWRRQQEISPERQEELTKCRAIVPDIEKGIYPFKGMKLSRADVEWLLATHDNGRGPVDWSEERQRGRKGLDLRGADLCQVDLSYLPLARMIGGLPRDLWFDAPEKQRDVAAIQKQRDMAAVYMQGAKFFGTHLEGAHLRWAHLENAHLLFTHLDRTHLRGAYLIRADLREAYMLRARLEDAVLSDEKHIGPLLVDAQLEGANLAVVNWTQVEMLGDENEALQKISDGKVKDKRKQLGDYEVAVRANRQLAVALQAQGLNEVASRFAYRAQKLQCVVLRRQKKYGQYFFSLVLDLLAGHGYRPGRSVFWYLIVIGGFAIMYSAFGHLPLLPDTLVFSLMSFHGRGFFPSLSGESNLHNPLVVLAALEAVVGLFIEISFIATFTQRFFGK